MFKSGNSKTANHSLGANALKGSIKGGLAGSLSRKKFVDFLSDFIRTESLLLKGTDSEAKLEIYRQVFDYFIQEFKTYSGILAMVKSEYECVILNLHEKVKSLEPLKGKLEILKLQNFQELNQQSLELDQFLEKIRKENSSLTDKNTALTNQIQQLRLEITNILQENSDLREKNSEILNKPVDLSQLENLQSEELKKKDIEIQKLQDLVKKKDKKVSILSKDLQVLAGNNEELISPEVFKAVKNELTDMNVKNSELKSTICKLKENINNLMQKKELVDKKVSVLESFKFPDWQYIQYHVPFSIRDYEVSLKESDCNDVIANILIEFSKFKSEIGNIKSSHGELSSRELFKKSQTLNSDIKKSYNSLEDYWMDSKISGIEIPKFLKYLQLFSFKRFKGKLKKRDLSKTQTLHCVYHIFEGKKGYDSLPKNKGKEIELIDFFSMYLKKRFGSKEAVIEWGVNILYYSNNYASSNAILNTFYKIISGIWDISVYYNLDSTISKLKSMFLEADLEFHNGESHGFVEPSQFLYYLQSSIWSHKSKSNIKALEAVLDENNYDNLFSVDSDFVNTVCLQELEETRTNLLAVTSGLKSEAVTFNAIYDLLLKTYTKKSAEEIKNILVIAYGKEKIKDSDIISKMDLLKVIGRYA